MGRKTINSNGELDRNSNVEGEESCTSGVRHSETNGCGNGHHVQNSNKAPFPFQFKYTPNKWQRLRFWLMFVFIFPIRMVVMLTCLVLAGLVAHVGVAYHPLDAKYRLSPIRRLFKVPVIILVRALFFVCGMHYVTVKGRRAISRDAPILCMAPHSSFMDVLIGFVCGLPVTVSTKQNAETPIVGTLFRMTEAIFIDRADPDSRQKSMDEIVRRARTRGEWPQIMTFPEGCCTNRKSLLTYKRGAFAAGVPIQPLLIRYNNDLDHATWVNVGPNQITLFMLLMCTPNTNLEIEYLTPYIPSEEEIHDPDLYAENVRRLMSKHLKIPISSYTYKDLKALLDETGKPKRGILYFLKTLWKKGEVVMPEKIPCHFTK